MSDYSTDLDEDDWENEWEADDPDAPDFAFEESMPIPPRHVSTISALRALENARNRDGRRFQLIAMVIFFGLFFNLRMLVTYAAVFVIHDLVVYVTARGLNIDQSRLFYLPVGRIGAPIYNHDGWRLATVALTSPLVGLVLGLISLFYAVRIKYQPLVDFGVIAVLINGAYLTVTSRLTDGGRFIESLLSCRWRYFEIVARLFAVAILGGYGFMHSEYFWIAIAAFILIGTKGVFSHVQATIALQADTSQWDADDGEHIPTNAALKICDEIESIYQDDTRPSIRAIAVQQIFQRLNLRPVGLVASLVLGLIYVIAVAVFLLAASILILD